MKNETVTKLFTTVSLLNGSKCGVLEVKSAHIFIANFRLSIQKKTEYDFTYFLFQQILLIDNKKITDEQLLNLSIDDFILISEVMDAAFKKITGIK
jgi:hypothetical protein